MGFSQNTNLMPAFVPRPDEGAVRMTCVSVNPMGATGQAQRACAKRIVAAGFIPAGRKPEDALIGQAFR